MSPLLIVITGVSMLLIMVLKFKLSALIAIAIASGSTILSHINDNGFWIVSKYMGMDEKQNLQSWTVMETIICLSGLILCLIENIFN